MAAIPASEEVRNAIFRLNGDSSSGLDGHISRFFHVYWDTVDLDIIRMVQDFFAGNTLSNSIGHTNLVLILKKDMLKPYHI